MPTLGGKTQQITIEIEGESHTVWIKAAWDAGLRDVLEAYFVKLKSGVIPENGPVLVMLRDAIQSWNYTQEDGSPSPINMATVKQLPDAMVDAVQKYYDELSDVTPKDQTARSNPLGSNTSIFSRDERLGASPQAHEDT